MKRIIYYILAMLLAGSGILAQDDDFPKLTGSYLGQQPPGMTPEIFAPGLVSTEQGFEFAN